MERVLNYLDAHAEHAPALCGLLLQLWPIPRRRDSVDDRPAMSEAECDAAAAWVDEAETNGTPDLFGPLRAGVPADEAGAHIWRLVETARSARGRAGAVMVLVRIFSEVRLFPYAGGVSLPPLRDDFTPDETIVTLASNPALFAQLALIASRHYGNSNEMGQMIHGLLAQTTDERERLAIQCFSYAVGMFFVTANVRMSAPSMVALLDPSSLMAAIAGEPAGDSSPPPTPVTAEEAEAVAREMPTDPKKAN
jgi:hypothetical protein